MKDASVEEQSTPVAVDGQGDQDDERERGSSSASRPACFSSTVQECLFVLTTTMAIGQSSFFGGLVVVVTASIGHDLNMNSAEITWISAGISYIFYSSPVCSPMNADHKNRLSSGAFLLAFGKMADLFGRKQMFVFGMAGFTIALVIAGFAKTAIYMDVFSGILGIFSAAVVPPAVGSLGAVYEKPSKRKNRAFACFSAGNPLGFVGGMIISGIAAQVANWRASFWALAVIYAVFTVLTIWTVPKDSSSGTAPWNWQSVKRCDPLGMILIVTGIALFSSSLS
jgi:MFS family permease